MYVKVDMCVYVCVSLYVSGVSSVCAGACMACSFFL